MNNKEAFFQDTMYVAMLGKPIATFTGRDAVELGRVWRGATSSDLSHPSEPIKLGALDGIRLENPFDVFSGDVSFPEMRRRVEMLLSDQAVISEFAADSGLAMNALRVVGRETDVLKVDPKNVTHGDVDAVMRSWWSAIRGACHGGHGAFCVSASASANFDAALEFERLPVSLDGRCPFWCSSHRGYNGEVRVYQRRKSATIGAPAKSMNGVVRVVNGVMRPVEQPKTSNVAPSPNGVGGRAAGLTPSASTLSKDADRMFALWDGPMTKGLVVKTQASPAFAAAVEAHDKALQAAHMNRQIQSLDGNPIKDAPPMKLCAKCKSVPAAIGAHCVRCSARVAAEAITDSLTFKTSAPSEPTFIAREVRRAEASEPVQYGCPSALVNRTGPMHTTSNNTTQPTPLLMTRAAFADSVKMSPARRAAFLADEPEPYTYRLRAAVEDAISEAFMGPRSPGCVEQLAAKLYERRDKFRKSVDVAIATHVPLARNPLAFKSAMLAWAETCEPDAGTAEGNTDATAILLLTYEQHGIAPEYLYPAVDAYRRAAAMLHHGEPRAFVKRR